MTAPMQINPGTLPQSQPTSPVVVPIRQSPQTPDADDQRRIQLVRGRWAAQDGACLARDRQVELAVRMLAGRQWDTWSDLKGRFVDPLEFMDDTERRWRQRPVVDYLRRGYQITVAKLTESPPVIAYEPATADTSDAQLAEVLDTVMKKVAHDANMDAMRPAYMGWAFTAGEVFLKSRPDYTAGPPRTLTGPAVLSMQGADGQPIERVTGTVPYDATGTPLASLTEDGEGYEVPDGAEPHVQPKGQIVVEVLNPLEIRSEWINKPLEQKRWVIHRTFLTSDEVYDRYGVWCDPDTWGEGTTGGATGAYLERLKFGAGYQGAALSQLRTQQNTRTGAGRQDGAIDGYVCVDEMWEKPCGQYPEGRLLVVTKDVVLWDSERPFDFEGAGPFRSVGALQLPGRMFKSTPFEVAIPLQKGINRIAAHLLEHTNRSANPILIVNTASGIATEDVTNEPGLILDATALDGGAPPLLYVAPPGISGDVYKVREWLEAQLITILSIPGSEGRAPTADASGELVEQLRYNADRAIAGIAHDAIRAEAGMARDWLAMLPTLWTEEEIITVAGEDGILRTVTVLPEMFDGSVNVRPVMNSMLPESRVARQERIRADYQLGVFGPPGSPQANDWYLKNMQYPDLNRESRPGGVDRITAEHNVALIVRGAQATAIPLYPQYDFGVHISVTRDYIASTQYLKLDPPVQEQLQVYSQLLQGAMVAQQMQQQRIAGAAQMALGAQQVAQHAQMQALLPPPPPPIPGGDASPGSPVGNGPPPSPASSSPASPAGGGA